MASGGAKSADSLLSLDWKSCVVSTVAGDEDEHSVDGIGTAAGLNWPLALIASGDGKSLVFTDSGSHLVRRFDLADRRVTTLLGSKKGFKQQRQSDAIFESACSVR